jgi:hypothetical protein
MKYPAKTSFVLSNAEASLRHIEAAILAFEEEQFDVVITLAGAAEGMAPTAATPSYFPIIQDDPKIGAAGMTKKELRDEWLNAARNWLRHAGENSPSTCEFHRFAAAEMLVRAITKAQAAFGFQSTTIDAFIETFRRSWKIDVHPK